MALSGNLTTNAYGGVRSLTLNWTATQNIANNTTTINWSLVGSGSTANYNPWYMTGPTKVVIDGSQVHYSTSRIQLRSGTAVASGSKTITHNTDGSKSITIRIEGAIYTTSINCTAKKSFTLNQIPRGASITDAPNFKDTDSPKITYSNPAGGSLQVGIYKTDGSTALAAYRAASGSSYTFTFSAAEKTNLQKVSTTSNTATVRFYLKSVVGGQTFIKSVDRTLTIASPSPTLSPTVVDSNSITVGLTGDANNKLIKYYSDAKITFGASAVKYSTLKSKSVSCGSKSLTADGTIQDIEDGKFNFSVTDSRNNTTTKTITKTLINYVKLTCNIENSNVPDGNGDFTFKVSGSYFNGTFGAVSNTLSVKYRYKVDGGTYNPYQSMTISKVGNSYTATVDITGLDYTKTYQFQAQVSDKLATVTTEEKSIRSTPVFDWSETDFNFNVPVKVQGNNLISRCGMTAIFYTSNGTGLSNLRGKTIVPLKFVRDSFGGAQLLNGSIKIVNDGVYLICGSVHYTGGTDGQWLGVYVYDSNNQDCGTAYTSVKSGMGTIITPTTIKSLKAGTTITLRAEASGGVVDVPNDSRTRLTVAQIF